MSTKKHNNSERAATNEDTHRHYAVFNATDGIEADPSLMTRQEAEGFVRAFPRRFDRQGYYKTARGNRIPAEEVVLLILDTTTLTPEVAGNLLPACRGGRTSLDGSCLHNAAIMGKGAGTDGR